MRWIVSLSSTLVLGMAVTVCAEEPLTSSTFVQSYRQPSGVTTQGTITSRYQGQSIPGTSFPAQVAMVTPDQTAAPATAVPASPVPIAQPAPVHHTYIQYQPVQRRSQGPFARLMELERRKNAWLLGLFR